MLPNLHNSYTTTGPLQVITGYTYDQLQTQGKSQLKSKPDKPLDYQAPPYSSANTPYCQKRIAIPHLPTCDRYHAAVFFSHRHLTALAFQQGKICAHFKPLLPGSF